MRECILYLAHPRRLLCGIAFYEEHLDPTMRGAMKSRGGKQLI
jgi:hypothetical protein